MLCDVKYFNNPVADMIAEINGNSTTIIRLEKGIYQIGHFNFEHVMTQKLDFDKIYPELGGFSCYGVCDDYKQILEQCEELKNEKRKFVVSVTPVEKSNQSKHGGWRWHKWGPYIGEYKSTCEYLYDEPEIEKIYCYNIYEI